MSNKIYFRRGTNAERGTVVLDSGEPGWTTDTKELYVGDGATYGGILVTGGAGGGAGTLCKLSDVNCAGTVNGKVLTYQNGTWIAETPAGGGDMLISQYVTGAGTVYNATRLGGDPLATVQAHNVEASKITSGTIGLARIPVVDDARIPDLETLSYGGAFATAQIPNLDGSKVTTGTFNADRIPILPTSRITTGTFGIARIPSITNAYLAGEITSDKISALSGTAITYPLNADTVGTTAIKSAGVGNVELAASGLDIAKCTVGTAGAARIPVLPTSRITTGTFSLNRIPTIDDARIPNLETLSYGAAFAAAQIPNLTTSKITTGSFNADRIPVLPTSRVTSGTFADARIPDVGVVAINYVIDGGGAAIIAGTVGFLEVPFACHVDRWTLLADQHGSVVIDIWRDGYSNYPPTNADSMPGTTNMPAISGTVAAQGTDLSGWGTQGIASGDILAYHVDSCSSIELCTIALKVRKT